jgi:type II secretory ATPase GspE/PulE/Tfp pilus assembly ATPase PilB-like protein
VGYLMTTVTLGAESFFLVSFWKPIILLVPLVGWLWVISRVYDKHAFRFHLNRQMWNLIHLSIGTLALLGALAIPMQGEPAFWIGLGVLVLALAVDLVAYAVVANRDERVPEEFHIKFNQIFSKVSEARAAKAAEKRAGKAELVIKSPDKSTVQVPERETPEFDVRITGESLVLRALGLRASQVDLGPTGKDGAYSASYLVDGVRQAGETMPGATAVRVIDFWKGAAKLDVNDRRRKLTGDVNIERGVDKVRLRLSTSGTQGGMRLLMLFDPERAVRKKADSLGFLDNQFAVIKELVAEGQGVVLLAAPADMGRTTTLYSVLKMHDAYTQNVQTVEMEPQDALEGVRQNKYEQAGEGPEYSTFVRSILRRDPQVVGVAEMPDEQTAKEIARADLERTRVYLSLRTDNTLLAIQAWMKAVGEPEQAAKALHGVLAQKLLRKLCVNCRVAYQASPEMLKKLGAGDKPRQLFKKGGQVLIKNKPEICPVCGGIGYVGQEGIFEIYALGKPERDLVKAGNWAGLRAEFRKKNLPTIQQAALLKAMNGVTSVEELLRVTAEGPAGGAGGGGSGGGGGGGGKPAPKAGPRPSPAATG